MATALSQNLPDALKSIRTRPLFVLRLQVPPYYVVGATPSAFRRIGIVLGGLFEGERLSGEVLGGKRLAGSSKRRLYEARRADCIESDGRRVDRHDVSGPSSRSSRRHGEIGQGGAGRSCKLLFPDESIV